MKKILIALAFVGLGTAANAQTTQIETPSKYCVATNSFWSNWYVQVGADMTLSAPYGAKKLSDNVFHQGKSFGVDLAVGKWFTPGLGLRLKAQWENGILDQHACACHPSWTANFDGVGEGSDFGAIYGDVQFNLSNLFCGYNESRVWNFIVYPRAGFTRVFDANAYTPVLGGGIENTWKLGKVVGLYLDVAYNVTTQHWGRYLQVRDNDNAMCNTYVTAELGLQFNLGDNTWQKAVTLDAYNALAAASEEALAKLRAELDKERAENARLRAELAKQPKPAAAQPAKVEKVVAAAATSVFFDLNSTTINSKKDLINLEAVAAVAKETGAKVVVTGSADSQTGSSAWNQKLSEGRANAAKDELVRLGVNADNIEVKAVGGINEVSPYILNRRAVVELK